MVQSRKNRLHSLSYCFHRMILLLSLSLLNRRQMKQTRFKRMVSFKPSPQQLQLCSRNDHDHQTPSTSLSLSARYFNFLLKPNHCFHHCISSYPPKPIFSFHSLREHDVMPSWRDHNDRAKHNLKHLICTKGYSDQVPDIANQQDREAHVLRGMQCGPRR